jgi:hypothetical protein
MSKQTNAISVRTIGIDTGKNTLHWIGLDQQVDDRFAREACSRPDWCPACQCAAVLDRDRGWYGDALCCSRAACARS